MHMPVLLEMNMLVLINRLKRCAEEWLRSVQRMMRIRRIAKITQNELLNCCDDIKKLLFTLLRKQLTLARFPTCLLCIKYLHDR
jgi:hypothetical protein